MSVTLSIILCHMGYGAALLYSEGLAGRAKQAICGGRSAYDRRWRTRPYRGRART